MSNYICCECGIAQIDCGGDGYKTPKEIELEKKLEIATKALEEYENKQNWDIMGVSFMKHNKGFAIARKALKEMKGVK